MTRSRWSDLEQLFGERGPVEGCWCMFWRLNAKEYQRCAGEKNKESLKQLVHDGHEPGLLAYRSGNPVGWCSVGPREGYGRLERSRTLRAVDDRPVWSIVCFYMDRTNRGSGIAQALLKGAIKHAATRGATTVEGYPLSSGSDSRAGNAYAYTGVVSMFEQEDFSVVANRGQRIVMRLALDIPSA